MTLSTHLRGRDTGLRGSDRCFGLRGPALLLLCIVTLALPARGYADGTGLEVVSAALDGGAPNDAVLSTDLSADGRFVVFTSGADNLVAADGNGLDDIFVADRNTGEIRRVSVASDGTQANGPSMIGRLATDGRIAVFSSEAENLDVTDTNNRSDIFLHDLPSGITARISVSTGGGQVFLDATCPAVSADGRRVAFVWHAAPNQTFIRDLEDATTTLVSRTPEGQPGNGASGLPFISADGRFVAFVSQASDLVAGDTNDVADVFVYDHLTGLVERAVALPDDPVNEHWVVVGGISATGRYLTYTTSTYGSPAWRPTVLDRATTLTQRVDVTTGGGLANVRTFAADVSADGRYVVLHSDAGNLDTGDTNGTADVFIRDLVTDTTVLVSETADGTQGAGFGVPHLGADGQVTVFDSGAPALLPFPVAPGEEAVLAATNCLTPSGPTVAWAQFPPLVVSGGGDVPLIWTLAKFIAPITENQVHFGIRSVLGSSDSKTGALGVHAHTFAAPNVGVFDSPTSYKYIVRALDGGAQVLSTIEQAQVVVGPNPPTVVWIQPPPTSAPNGSQFTVEWQLLNFVDPAPENATVWGISHVIGHTANQPGGNGTYTAVVDVPVTSSSGTLFYAAAAQNEIEFAFSPITPVFIVGP